MWDLGPKDMRMKSLLENFQHFLWAIRYIDLYLETFLHTGNLLHFSKLSSRPLFFTKNIFMNRKAREHQSHNKRGIAKIGMNRNPFLSSKKVEGGELAYVKCCDRCCDKWTKLRGNSWCCGFSYFDQKRFRNILHLNEYLKTLRKNKIPIDFEEGLDKGEKDYLCIQLRLIQELNLNKF